MEEIKEAFLKEWEEGVKEIEKEMDRHKEKIGTMLAVLEGRLLRKIEEIYKRYRWIVGEVIW